MSLEMMIGCTGDACSDWVREPEKPALDPKYGEQCHEQSVTAATEE